MRHQKGKWRNRKIPNLIRSIYLRNRQNGHKVHPEIILAVSFRNGHAVSHKLPSSKDPRGWRNESRPKPEPHVYNIKEIRDGSEHSHCYLQVSRNCNAASVIIHLREVEVEGIDEDSHQARNKKKSIPPVKSWACRVQNVVPLGFLRHVLGRALKQ